MRACDNNAGEKDSGSDVQTMLYVDSELHAKGNIRQSAVGVKPSRHPVCSADAMRRTFSTCFVCPCGLLYDPGAETESPSVRTIVAIKTELNKISS
jgi:hypothetical protein